VTPVGEQKVAKIVSLIVKVSALAFILYLPTQFALDLQLLGGVCILQTFPAVVFGLFFNWFRAPALLLGWAVGLIGGTTLAFLDGIKPVHTLLIRGEHYTVYTGLLALALNIAAAVGVQFLQNRLMTRAPRAR